jgi:hypothetical protein
MFIDTENLSLTHRGIALVHHPTSEITVRSPRPRHGDPTGFHLPDCPTRRDHEIAPRNTRVTVFLGRCYQRGLPAIVLCRATTLARPTGPDGKGLISSRPATGRPSTSTKAAKPRGTSRNHRPSQHACRVSRFKVHEGLFVCLLG